jgi:hypothetical protein
MPVSMCPDVAQGVGDGVGEGDGVAVGAGVGVGRTIGVGGGSGVAVKTVGTTAATALVGNDDGGEQATSVSKSAVAK